MCAVRTYVCLILAGEANVVGIVCQKNLCVKKKVDRDHNIIFHILAHVKLPRMSLHVLAGKSFFRKWTVGESNYIPV
jgi:hypothetical protein